MARLPLTLMLTVALLTPKGVCTCRAVGAPCHAGAAVPASEGCPDADCCGCRCDEACESDDACPNPTPDERVSCGRDHTPTGHHDPGCPAVKASADEALQSAQPLPVAAPAVTREFADPAAPTPPDPEAAGSWVSTLHAPLYLTLRALRI